MDFNLTQILLISGKSIIIYLFIIVAIRLFGKNELSQLSVIDLVFILLISNSVQNAMVGKNDTLWGGIAAATSLFLINYIFKWLLRSIPGFSSVVQGDVITLIYEGQVQQLNLDKARITLDELHAAVREHGVATFEEVNLAVLEVDGNISVMSRDYHHKTVRRRKAHKIVTKSQ